MADTTADDDIYNDPATIGKAPPDRVDGAPDRTPPSKEDDLSESIYVPEKNTTDIDDRGPIDELEAADAADISELEELDPDVDESLLDEDPTRFDPDDYHPGDVEPKDEQDGTES